MPVTLATERLRLRQWDVSDAEQLRALWAERDPRSLRLIDQHGNPTVSDLRSRLEADLVATAETGLALLAIERIGNPGFIGYCGLIVGRATQEEPEIAFELFRRVHGFGFATEAGRAVVAAAAATGRARLWSTVRAWNQPSLRVLENSASSARHVSTPIQIVATRCGSPTIWAHQWTRPSRRAELPRRRQPATLMTGLAEGENGSHLNVVLPSTAIGNVQ
jgi:RimJ/RimL family protein N-acetyltransferase